MIFEDKKLADVDLELLENNGFNVVVSPKVLRSNNHTRCCMPFNTIFSYIGLLKEFKNETQEK